MLIFAISMTLAMASGDQSAMDGSKNPNPPVATEQPSGLKGLDASDSTESQAIPAVEDDMIVMYPGETIYVEGEWTGWQFTKLHQVEFLRDPSRTITFKLEEFEEAVSPAESTTILTITNPFGYGIKYAYGIKREQSEPFSSPKRCWVSAGRKAVRSWPHYIDSMIFADIVFFPEIIHEECD